MKKAEQAVLYAVKRYGSMTDDEIIRHVRRHTGLSKDKFIEDKKIIEARASLVFKRMLKQDPEAQNRYVAA